jgi:dihydroxyacetone kinase-like predicted kinase
VTSIEITRSIRSVKLNGFDIKKKQAIGFLDGAMVSVAEQPADVLREILGQVDMKDKEVVTIYYGADTTQAEAEVAAGTVREKSQNLQVEVIKGGQPHYNFIVSVE